MISRDAALLTALRRSPEGSALDQLARELHLERRAIVEALESLRGAGFEIETHPTRGCRLIAAPDRLIADDLWSRLALASASAGAPGSGPSAIPWLRDIVVLAETGSTNDVAARLGRDGVAGGVLVAAESQTAGRGRFGRRWASAPGRGLWFSLLLRPELPMERWPRLTTWAAVAAAAAIEAVVPAVRCAIKWPNDLQISGKKVAGILIETGSGGRQQPFAVLGIGINVNQQPEEFPPELHGLAQSLRMSSGAPIDRPALLARILAELAATPPESDDAFAHLVETAQRRSSLLGRWVQVRTGTGTDLIEGIAEALDLDGQLLLRDATGHTQVIRAGEVSIRRIETA